MGGAGTLVRQGVKVGGKKGGRAVQKGTTAATAAGREAAANAARGNQKKMVGSGKYEKAGALAGGLAGGVAGAVIPDGPLMVAGEIAGGIAGSKIGGKIGRQFDKRSLKKESFSDWRKDLGEEGYDKIKDARLVNYGIGHDGSDKKGSVKRAPETKVKGKTVLQKETEKKYGKGVSAIDVVKADIKSKYGKGAIYDGKKK